MGGTEGSGMVDGAAAAAEIAALTPALIERTAHMLVEAFKTEEGTVYHLDTQRPSALRRLGILYGLFLRLYHEAGRPVLTGLKDGEVLGAIIITDPRIPLSRRRAATLLLPNLRHLLAHAARHPIRYLRIIAATRHPEGLTKPYFTCEMLGVHPDHQEKGIGAALMHAAQAMGKDDPAVTGIYLNTASEGNRAFYEDLAFDSLRIDDLGPVKVYHMFWQNPAFG